MDTMKSFKGYGKVDPKEEEAFKRKTRNRFIIILLSFACLLAITIGIVVGTFETRKNNNNNALTTSTISSNSKALEAICSVTNYPESCYSSISSIESSSSNTSDPEKVFQMSLQVAYKAMKKLSVLPQKLMNKTNDPFIKQALGVCEEVFDDAIDMLKDVKSSMNNKEDLSVIKINDLKTWLTTVITDQETCLDALMEVNAPIINVVKRSMKDPSEFASNSLAIVSKVLNILGVSNLPTNQNRKLLVTSDDGNSGLPNWVGSVDRKLLFEINLKPDVTVAQDGSGDVDTIGKAVAIASGKKGSRFVIYVKAGLYKEIVRIDKKTSNVMMYGDGMYKTVVSFNLNTIDGNRTFHSATFAVTGKNFIARDMGFKNTAGAIKEQAVALRSGSDHSVFYRCSFDGFQDTLYAHSNRQFYKECDITGTVDFIFGNAAVIFQDCKIMPRQPLKGQLVTITAQGKNDSNQNSGISIQNCVVTPLDNLTAPTYLGRPWKNYSTTVVMQTSIGGFLNPEGWTQWAPELQAPDTIFYAEYQNKGPGADVSKRVKWSGYLPALNVDQAARFTVEFFLGEENWLTDLNIFT